MYLQTLSERVNWTRTVCVPSNTELEGQQDSPAHLSSISLWSVYSHTTEHCDRLQVSAPWGTDSRASTQTPAKRELLSQQTAPTQAQREERGGGEEALRWAALGCGAAEERREV